jgi:hypothetical protein
MQPISPTSPSITAAAPVTGVWATGRWDGDVSKTTIQILQYGLLLAGRKIIKNRGVIFSDTNKRFRVEYDVNSKEKSKERIEAREDRERLKLESDIALGLSWAQKQWLIERKAEEKAQKDKDRAHNIYMRLQASINLAEDEKLYTRAEGKWWLRYETREERATALAVALPSDLIWRYRQSSHDRLMGSGYQWAGGLVANKYFQKPFIKKGLISEEHWLLQRFIAACAKASTGEFKAGKSKDTCWAIRRKIIGFDEPYVFFGQRCKELFRVDLDRWFADEAELRAWLGDLMERGTLKFMPHVVSWIFDDVRPGIYNPHVWFVLPEGSAVWDDKLQHCMLNQVIASLTLALGGDPGGLSSPFHGKNPVSVHCDYTILNDESFPTLGDYAKGMKLTHAAARMARKIMNDRMAEVGFDPRESNTWFTGVSRAAREAAKQLYKSGFRIGHTAEFEEAVYEITLAAMETDLPRMNAKQRENVEKLVETCSRWTVSHFDPTKMDKSGLSAGAAAHLMLPEDDAKTRKGKGGAYAAKVEGERYCGEVAVAIGKALQAGGAEPTFRQIADATGFVLNTVKKHWLQAFAQAVASLSIQILVKGVAPSTKPYKASQAIPGDPSHGPEHERTARSVAGSSPHRPFPGQAARGNRSKRRSGRPIAPVRVRAMPGRNVIDFLSAGGVRIYRRKPADSQPA